MWSPSNRGARRYKLAAILSPPAVGSSAEVAFARAMPANLSPSIFNAFLAEWGTSMNGGRGALHGFAKKGGRGTYHTTLFAWSCSPTQSENGLSSRLILQRSLRTKQTFLIFFAQMSSWVVGARLPALGKNRGVGLYPTAYAQHDSERQQR